MNSEKAKVLYVDDDERNLSAFKRAFRRDYDVVIATSAKEGIKQLEENEFQVILTDQRMPEMTGVEFLSQINQKYPDTVRLLITGYADLNAVIDAINQGKIYRYIAKPYEESELRDVIDDALSHYKDLNRKRLALENYQKAFADSLDPSFQVGSNGKIINANPAFLKLLDISRGQLFDLEYRLMFDDPDLIKKLLEEITDKGFIKDFETKVRVGSVNKDILLSIRSYEEKDTQRIKYQGTLKDISDFKKKANTIVKEMMNSHEDIREEISRQLHDNFAQKLAGIKFFMSTLSKKGELIDEQSLKALASSDLALDNIIKELREICFKLIPLSITSDGLKEALTELGLRLQEKHQIIFDLDCEDLSNVGDKNEQLLLFRVIHELIHIELSHKEIERIKVNVMQDRNDLVFFVNDFGAKIRTTAEFLEEQIGDLMNRVAFFKGSLVDLEDGRTKLILPISI